MGRGSSDRHAPPRELPLKTAEEHGVLQQVASVYSSESNLLVDGFYNVGPRIVTFAKILRDSRLKLGELLTTLLSACEKAMRSPVEIEFAVDMVNGNPPVFYPLQMRPMASKRRWEKIEITPELRREAVCRTTLAHGNGAYRDLFDIVAVKPGAFDKGRTREIADDISKINKRLVAEHRPYILIGFGRWGSTDPEMGIGVKWAQISGVRVLVEAGLKGFDVDPAQGTHFFQNVTSLNIGCLSIPYGKDAFLNWDWLAAKPALTETEFLRHIRVDRALTVLIDGRGGEAIIVE